MLLYLLLVLDARDEHYSVFVVYQVVRRESGGPLADGNLINNHSCLLIDIHHATKLIGTSRATVYSWHFDFSTKNTSNGHLVEMSS